MLITFAKHGQGSASAAADYLLADRDHVGKERAEVTVLRGDPHQVAQVADSLDFEHRYRSAVIAWAPEDDPTDREIEETLDQFEYVSWSGLEPDRYAWSAVLHRDDDGGAHVHVLAARVELETGKSHNIAPPGWERTYGLLERAMNHEHGWARPDDPDRARSTRPGRFPADAADRDAIDDYLRQRVAAGLVHDRAGVVAAFEEAGYEVPRQGKHYLTVAHPETGQRLRLKGTLYEQDFQAAEYRGRLEREDGAGPGGASRVPAADRGHGEGGDAQASARAWRDLDAICRRRAEANRERYPSGSPEHGPDARNAMAPDRTDRVRSLHGHLVRALGDGAVAAEPDRGEQEPDRGGHRVDALPRRADRRAETDARRTERGGGVDDDRTGALARRILEEARRRAHGLRQAVERVRLAVERSGRRFADRLSATRGRVREAGDRVHAARSRHERNRAGVERTVNQLRWNARDDRDRDGFDRSR
ncbi:MAG: relaxase/mobilization nuclease domain-containing protein [Holophagales bacterium]|nr:relaxase/mobilization nuclease domain-containing protein [Holophagales bacterium]